MHRLHLFLKRALLLLLVVILQWCHLPVFAQIENTDEISGINTSNRPKLIVLGFSKLVFSVAFSPDGRFILTGINDDTAKLWDAATGQEIRIFKGHSGVVTSVAYSPDGRFILTGSSDNTA